jgi:uncharacterized protein YpmB
MNTGEWIMLIQTIVLAVTGFIVYWYTKETQKIRKETSNQNTILAEQLRILKESKDLETKKEQSLAEPLFRWIGGVGFRDHAEIEMVNKGATIKNVGVKTSGNILIQISPSSIIGSDDKVKVTIKNLPSPLPDKIIFEINYHDKLGNYKHVNLTYYPSKLLLVNEDL